MATITLADGEHELKAPTAYVGELLRDWADDPVGFVAICTAAVLTGSEEMDARWRPEHIWYPGEVASLMPQKREERDAIASTIFDLLTESGIFDESAGESADPTTPGSDTP